MKPMTTREFAATVVVTFGMIGIGLALLPQIAPQTVSAKGKLQITQDGEYLIYPAEITRVLDGDTVDLQFRIWVDTIREERIRLLGIDAPEVRGEERPEGLKTTEYLKNRLEGKQAYLKTDGKDDKYGRLLGIIMIAEDGVLVDLNKELLEKDLASPYN